jgi:hypothetical protein
MTRTAFAPGRLCSTWLLATALAVLGSTPAQAQQSTAAVAADLRMAQDAAPFRRTVDSFVERARAGDVAATQAMLSRALRERMGDAAVRKVMEQQIVPFFANARGLGKSTTVTNTTDAAGQRGFAFYLWLEPAGDAPARPFTVYVVDEGGTLAVANIVPDRLVEGRHR